MLLIVFHVMHNMTAAAAGPWTWSSPDIDRPQAEYE